MESRIKRGTLTPVRCLGLLAVSFHLRLLAGNHLGSRQPALHCPPFVHSEDPWMCHQGLAAAGFAASGLGVIAPGVFPEMVDAVPDSDPTTRIGDGFLLPIWRI